MATAIKYEHFVEALANAEIDMFGTTDTFRAVLHSDAPVAATDDELADLTQVSGTGYTSGGDDIQNDATRTGGTVTNTAVDVTWTAGAGDWGAFRYVSIDDDTATGDVLKVGYDYGEDLTLGDGESFTLDFGATFSTLT